MTELFKKILSPIALTIALAPLAPAIAQQAATPAAAPASSPTASPATRTASPATKNPTSPVNRSAAAKDATNSPARPRPARGAAARADQTKAFVPLTTMQQLCRVRESELLQLANNVRLRAMAIVGETDPKKQSDLVASYESSRRLMAEGEASWQRLGCLTILYIDRGTAGR